jgi:DNA polymerase-3 subunit gamma/tau
MASHLARICAQEGVPATEEALALVAQAATGSLREALSLLDRLLGLADGTLDVAAVQAGLGMSDPQGLLRLARALAQGQMAAAWEELHRLQAAGAEPRQLARSLGGLAKELLWRQLGGRAGAAGSSAVEAVPAPPGFWLDLLATSASAGTELRRADDPWMSLEASLLRLAATRSVVAGEERPVSAPPRPGLAEPAGARPVEVPVAAQGTQEAESEAALPAAARGADGVGRWADILAWLGRDNVPVQALLKSGRPTSHFDGVLTVEFNQKFSSNEPAGRFSARRWLCGWCRPKLALSPCRPGSVRRGEPGAPQR